MLCLAYKTLKIKKYITGRELLKSSFIYLFFCLRFALLSPSSSNSRRKGSLSITHTPAHSSVRLPGLTVIGWWARALCHCLVHYLEVKRSKLRSEGEKEWVFGKIHGRFLFESWALRKTMNWVGINYWTRVFRLHEELVCQVPGTEAVTVIWVCFSLMRSPNFQKFHLRKSWFEWNHQEMAILGKQRDD